MSGQTKIFEQDLYLHIPIAKQMGVRALEISADRALVSAPLSANINHNSTGFGGSVYAVAVLSCWALISETVRAHGLESGYIVIQDGEISYDSPVDADFTAEGSWPTLKDRDLFLQRLRKKGIARARLVSRVLVGTAVHARLSARFVAQLRRGATVTGASPGGA